MQQDDEHARSKPVGTSGGSAAAPTSRAGGTRECRETLEAGAVGMARAHLAVMLARPLLEGAALYPAAMARLYLPYISPISPYISGARALDLGSRAMGTARPAWRGDLVSSK